MCTFNDLPKLPKKDEEFFKNLLRENEKDFKIILPVNFEVKESPWKKIDGFSFLEMITVGEYSYRVFYLLDAEAKKGFFYFYHNY